MNRQFGYNWIKEFVGLKQTAEIFSRELSLRSQAIERIIPLTYRCKGIITAKVVKVQSHPNADKLRLATVTTGTQELTVVCGAPNLGVNQIVAFAPEGSIVLDPHDTSKTITLKAAIIRGVESRGMICASDELGLGGDHGGIMNLPLSTPLGTPLEKLLPPDDVIFDIEITSNRPDAMAVFGLAQEAAAVFGTPIKQSAMPQPNTELGDTLSLDIDVHDSKTCPRYQAAILSNITVEPSPLWLQVRLLSAGIRPISNIVDITNFVLLEYGQPMHAFDYDKLTDHSIVVRPAKAGEKLFALDGQTYELNSKNLVIADNKQPVAIAGVMGGADSAVSPATKTIVFEAANFDAMAVRKTARQLNLHSESSSLFEKGLHAEGTMIGLLRAVELAQKICGAKLAAPLFDVSAHAYKPTVITFDPAIIDRYLGITMSVKDVTKILTLLGFEVTGSKELKIIVPWWRANDIEHEYDLVEEVARMYGYHILPSELPATRLPSRPHDRRFDLEDSIKDSFVTLGFSELYNYSMVKPGDPLYGTAEPIRISNPLSDDMQVMRTSLVPQLLQSLSDNSTRSSDVRMFELSNVYIPTGSKTLPEEKMMLVAGAITESDPVLFIKGVAQFILKKCGQPAPEFIIGADTSTFDETQSLTILVNGKQVGQCGLVASNVAQRFGLKKSVALCSFDGQMLLEVSRDVSQFVQIPEFPTVERDIAIVLPNTVSWHDVVNTVVSVNDLIADVAYQSTYRDETLGAMNKSIAFRVVFRSNQRTLRSEEVDDVIKQLMARLAERCQARLR